MILYWTISSYNLQFFLSDAFVHSSLNILSKHSNLFHRVFQSYTGLVKWFIVDSGHVIYIRVYKLLLLVVSCGMFDFWNSDSSLLFYILRLYSLLLISFILGSKIFHIGFYFPKLKISYCPFFLNDHVSAL